MSGPGPPLTSFPSLSKNQAVLLESGGDEQWVGIRPKTPCKQASPRPSSPRRWQFRDLMPIDLSRSPPTSFP